MILNHKLLREMKKNFRQFFSIFLMILLSMAMYVTFAGESYSMNFSRDSFHEETKLSDLWIYSEGFSEEQLETIQALDFVEAAMLRMSVTGSAPDHDGAQIDLFLQRENAVNKPYVIDGAQFNPKDTEGIWISNAFAVKRNVQIGDDFRIEYNGIAFTKKVKGLIENAEYEFREAEGDADVFLENIACVYMGYDAFPARDYVKHLIKTGEITARKIEEESHLPKKQLAQLEAHGLTIDDITEDMLLEIVGNMSDEKLCQLLPYTEMVVVTTDRGALAHEDEIDEALNHDYAAIIDRASVPGLARLDGEMAQHKSFSYVFCVIFLGIGMLLIATSMSRMVAGQRTQIGTLNAMGMGRWKILTHYLSYSFYLSLLGVAGGILLGLCGGVPFMLKMFGAYYIVPGLKVHLDGSLIVMGAAIVLICCFCTYLSCRKLLRVKPSEALRPAAPKKSRHIWVEKFAFWKKLSFYVQYNIRDVFRAKLRTIMCVVGTAFGMILMIYGVGCNNLLEDMVDLSFHKITNADYQMNFSENAKLSDLEKIARDTDGELVMTDAIELSKQENATSKEKEKLVMTVLEGKGLYHILDVNQNVMQAKPGGVTVSRKAASDLDISIGDTVFWHIYSENTWHKATVTGMNRSPESQGITYLRDDFEKTGMEFKPTVLYSKQDVSEYADKDFVISVNSLAERIAAYEKSMAIINYLVYFITILSVIMIVIVLYHSGSLSFNERVKEFATLKVLGLSSSGIRRIMTMQNACLSIIGILIGAPFGNAALNAMMNSNGENFDYYLQLHMGTYVVSGILVLVTSALIGFLFNKRIKRLDLVGTLKGVE